MNWYIVQAYSGFEKKVVESIKDELKKHKLSDKLEEILVPTHQVTEVKKGKRTKKEKKFFPGYVLVQMDLDDENSWEGILSSTMFAIRSTVHTTTQHTPSQLVFGRDSFQNVNQEANCQQCKQALINKGNQKENRRRQSHVYHTGDKVLLKNAWKTKFNQDAYIGPYTVTEVWNNGTICTSRGNVTDSYNARNITPFKE